MGRFDYLHGVNTPYDAGIQPTFFEILGTGANNTYVNDRRQISNMKSDSDSAFVEVADGSRLSITASGTLINHSTIQAHFVSSFSNNLIGISPIIDKGAVSIIQSQKMTLVGKSVVP